MNRLSSRKYRDGAKGETCKLNIPGVCNFDSETVVFAHIRDEHTGGAIKASDISGVDACSSCHANFDGQAGEPMIGATWMLYALRGLQRTLENRIERGILVFPHDPPSKPSTKPPKASGRKIASKGFGTQHRPLRSNREFGK